MTIRVLITGAAGQLGHELQRCIPEGCVVVTADRAALDMTDAIAVHRFVTRQQPNVVINAAAYTAVDRAESEADVAESVNVTAGASLARAASDVDARVIHVSTDFVFGDGPAVPRSIGEPTAPLSVYGRTKRDGEAALFDVLGQRALVIRTAWVYSAHGGNFVKTMLRLMQERDEVRVVSDQIGSPTWANSLARVIWAAVHVPQTSGVLHWTDAGVASWYDFAVAVQEEARALGLLPRGIPLHPIRTSDYPTPARRPAYSVLDTSDAVRMLGVTPVHWRVNLRQMLGELAHA